MTKTFIRVRHDKKIWGVCTGLERYTGIDKVLWRVLFVIGLLTPCNFGFAYILIALLSNYGTPIDHSLYNENTPKN